MDELVAPDLPDNLQYLWIEYINIRRGAEVVDYKEIESYLNVTGGQLTPWEISVILEIDKTRLKDDG